MDAADRSLRLGRALCAERQPAERREWWVTNGRGAYASGTLAGTLTRRYHGLLIAPLHPPLGRLLTLSKADATLFDGARRCSLHANRWADESGPRPRGYRHLECFTLEGNLACWRFAIGDLVIEQRLWMTPDADEVHLLWQHCAGVRDTPLRLEVDLLVNPRDHHGVTASPQPPIPVVAHAQGIRAWLDARCALDILVHGGGARIEPASLPAFMLTEERARGFDHRDHHQRIARLVFTLPPGQPIGFDARVARLPPDPPSSPSPSPSPSPPPSLAQSLARRQRHDQSLLRRFRARTQAGERRMARTAPAWIRRLVLAADQFLIARRLPDGTCGRSVIAGYPWFGDWGRDTLIALPGLTLATGRPDVARDLLLTLARFIDAGMIPNTFPGAGETPAYNSVDASLWYLEATRAYLAATGDTATLEALYPVLSQIVAAYRDGTRHGIGLDPQDGLLRAGEPGLQLTWMDAKVDDWVVTPRHGKAVEINALWYNGLRFMAAAAQRLGLPATDHAGLAAAAADGFQRFVLADGQGLADVLDGPRGIDRRVRPNQILAVSLPESPLTPAQQAAVVAVCGRELLTSYGLRSLGSGDPDYRGRYRGDPRQRDGSYHQGCVWGWLLGHYALAEARVGGDRAGARARLTPLAEHLTDAGLGGISELFDGDPPHRPRGAPLQAWSVACTLEAWWRLGPD